MMLVLFTVVLLFLTAYLLLSHILSKQSVVLVDFACYKPPESQKCSRKKTLDLAEKLGCSKDTLCFMEKMVQGIGIGDSTYVPETILTDPPKLTKKAAIQESKMVMFGAIDSVLAKTKVECNEIGILIVNCTIFNVVPSLSSIIVNNYKLRQDICIYNLTGMGCAASLLAIGLAKHLLQVHQNTCALIVSSENTTSSIYTGNDPSKAILNCVFRVGGTAILLSNKPSHRRRSKYELMHAVQTNTASDDVAYKAVFQEEDGEGITGITTTKDLLVAATFTIGQHLKTLASLILPLSEQFLSIKAQIMKTQPHIPKYNTCVQHFFPHVGAKPVQDQVQKKLGFTSGQMDAARMTLHRFGNTSSSSIWYELAYAEAKGSLKKGDRVWQMAYGSGFKCCSVIWRALRDVGVDNTNPWMSDINDYPMVLDSDAPLPYPLEQPILSNRC